MTNRKPATSDEALELARTGDYSQVFNEVVFRSLQPLSLGLVVMYILFVAMGLIDDHSPDTRLVLVSTDAATAVVFLFLYIACRRDMLRARWINPLGLAVGTLGTSNVWLAYRLVEDPFYLTYLPMIVIGYGALLLSLPWLLICMGMVVGGTALVVGDALPLELAARYSPAMVGAGMLAIIILIVRRRGVIAAQKALIDAKDQLESRRKVEQQLAHSQRLDSLGKLVSGIAHEFNNLLMVIIGYADDLATAAKGGSTEKHDLIAIRDAGERAAALAGKLLAFSRQQALQTRVIDANDLIINAKPLLERSVPGDVRLSFDLDADVGFVDVDPLQIEQVLLNLVLNARDALVGAGGEISIATSVEPSSSADGDDGFLRIDVADTGAGMPPEIADRVFEPFFTTKEDGSGTGLGLATVYGIVTQSGGSIEIESEPGKGSTFHVRLPRIEEPEAAQPAPAFEPDELLQTATGTVLVVDDEPDVREVVSKTLEKRGFRVLTADSGDAAIEIAATEEVDAFLTDIVMPGMSGIELVDELRRRGHRQHVIFMSGHAAETDLRTATDSADTSLLRKPFRGEELVRAVAIALERTPQSRSS